MVVVVVLLNLALALYGFYLACHVWRLRQAFSRAADALIVAERSTYAVLHGAPEAILKGQMGARDLRLRYQQLEPKFQRARQALALVSMGRSLFLRPALTQRLRKSATKRVIR